MALSASIDFSLTARQVITDSLEDLGILSAGEAPTAEDAAKAMRKLNMLLKSWQKYENLWRLTEGSQALSNSTFSYSLSPVPHRVVAMRYRDSNSNDLPMTLLTREEYYDLPNKSVDSAPSEYYVDYQRSTVTVYLWQCPSSVTTESLQFTYQKKFDDIDSLDNDIEVRAEHLKMLSENLSVALGPSFGRVSSARFAELKDAAIVGLEQALDEDREDEIRFVPGYRSMGMGSRTTPY